jgi:hypothetical protein
MSKFLASLFEPLRESWGGRAAAAARNVRIRVSDRVRAGGGLA